MRVEVWFRWLVRMGVGMDGRMLDLVDEGRVILLEKLGCLLLVEEMGEQHLQALGPRGKRPHPHLQLLILTLPQHPHHHPLNLQQRLYQPHPHSHSTLSLVLLLHSALNLTRARWLMDSRLFLRRDVKELKMKCWVIWKKRLKMGEVLLGRCLLLRVVDRRLRQVLSLCHHRLRRQYRLSLWLRRYHLKDFANSLLQSHRSPRFPSHRI